MLLVTSHHFFANKHFTLFHTKILMLGFSKSLCKAEITAMEQEEKEVLAALEVSQESGKRIGHFDGV